MVSFLVFFFPWNFSQFFNFRALTKRAVRDKVFVIRFRIKYRKTKSIQLLIAAAANIRERIIQAFRSNPNTTTVDFYISGNAQTVAIVITFSVPSYISEIGKTNEFSFLIFSLNFS